MIIKRLSSRLFLNSQANISKRLGCWVKDPLGECSRNFILLSLSLLSFGLFSLDVLVVLVLDLVELLHVLVEIFAPFEGDKQFSSLDKSGLALFSFLFSSLVASRFLNLDGLSDKTNVVCIAIPNKLFGGDHTDGSRVSKSVKNKFFVLLEGLLAEIDIECLILSVGHVDLVRFNFEVLVASDWCLHSGLFLALHD